MDVIENKSRKQILQSIQADIAKAKNEVRCAQKDLGTVYSRLEFNALLITKLLEREEQ